VRDVPEEYRLEHEGLYLSKKDVRRYELLPRVIDRSLTVSQVTEAVGVSYRQARRQKAKLAAQGLPWLCHITRGRPPGDGSSA